MKKWLAMILCAALFLSVFGTAFAEGKTYPEYLNVESGEPIIKDEYAGKIKPSLMIVQDSTGGEWDDLYISKLLNQRYNLEFEVESVLSSALSERKSLLFASGDLPDMMWNVNLSNSEIMLYGQQEGLLYALETAADEVLCPYLYSYLQQPEIIQACTTPDGHVYSLPVIVTDTDEGSYPRAFLHYSKMQEMGYDYPHTLDELNTLLYAFKELDPENNVPISGGMETSSAAFYLLNALGYTSQFTMNYGEKPALRDGEVVIPAYDMEVFQEYLKLMHQYYEDGIINSNFFTIENAECIAQLNNEQYILFGGVVYPTGYQNWAEWEAVYPLTSEWNDKEIWSKPAFIRIGGCAVAATTEYVDLCLRICELYFQPSCYDLWEGPSPDSEWTLGYTFPGLNETNDWLYWDEAALPCDLWTYLMQYTCGFMPSFGALDDLPAYEYAVASRGGTYKKVFDLDTPEGQYRASVYEHLLPYAIATYPQSYFLSEEDTITQTDLQTLIEPYIKEQVALFITGDRSLTDTDAFVAELQGMGIDSLLDIYKGAYNG